MPRFTGVARSAWQREGTRLAVEYTGRADDHAVVDHYVRGHAAPALAQTVLSARSEAQTHEYARGAEHYRVGVTRQGRDGVSVRIEPIRS